MAGKSREGRALLILDTGGVAATAGVAFAQTSQGAQLPASVWRIQINAAADAVLTIRETRPSGTFDHLIKSGQVISATDTHAFSFLVSQQATNYEFIIDATTTVNELLVQEVFGDAI